MSFLSSSSSILWLHKIDHPQNRDLLLKLQSHPSPLWSHSSHSRLQQKSPHPSQHGAVFADLRVESQYNHMCSASWNGPLLMQFCQSRQCDDSVAQGSPDPNGPGHSAGCIRPSKWRFGHKRCWFLWATFRIIETWEMNRPKSKHEGWHKRPKVFQKKLAHVLTCYNGHAERSILRSTETVASFESTTLYCEQAQAIGTSGKSRRKHWQFIVIFSVLMTCLGANQWPPSGVKQVTLNCQVVAFYLLSPFHSFHAPATGKTP